MLSHLKIHVILLMDIVVVMLLCSMLEINDDCIALHCIALYRASDFPFQKINFPFKKK